MSLWAWYQAGFAAALLMAVLSVLLGGEMPMQLWLSALVIIGMIPLRLQRKHFPGWAGTGLGLGGLVWAGSLLSQLGIEAAVLAAGVAWTSDPLGAWRALCCLVVGAWVVGVVALVMNQSEPQGIHVSLPVSRGLETGAMALVVGAWLQPCLWPAVLSVAVRSGMSAAALVLCWGALGLVVAAAASSVCARWGTRSLPMYAALGACLTTWLGHVAMGGGVT